MSAHKALRSTASLILLLAFTCHPAIAETPDPPRWFTVEILIFSHTAGPSDGEQWEATPRLEYPSEYRFLIDPDYLANARAEQDFDGIVDEQGRLIFGLPAQSATAGDETATGSDQADHKSAPEAFTLLPKELRQLGDGAGQMRRSGRYEILFHEVWNQPVVERRDSLSIVLDRSGDTGSWPRLQGSILLYLSRYLHLETNLWLNTAGEYLPGTWRMPSPPLGPPSIIQDTSLPQAGWESATEVAAPVGTAPERTVAEEAEAVPAPTSPYRHAVTLQEKRRMRSREIHYLDHPLFGLVITLTPLELAEPAEEPVEEPAVEAVEEINSDEQEEQEPAASATQVE